MDLRAVYPVPDDSKWPCGRSSSDQRSQRGMVVRWSREPPPVIISVVCS